jgi:hypothetical protein
VSFGEYRVCGIVIFIICRQLGQAGLTGREQPTCGLRGVPFGEYRFCGIVILLIVAGWCKLALQAVNNRPVVYTGYRSVHTVFDAIVSGIYPSTH